VGESVENVDNATNVSLRWEMNCAIAFFAVSG
jgi:hypothetical protein